MHIMCVRGVYVTDLAHNIIFVGKRPAIFVVFYKFLSVRIGFVQFGSTFSVLYDLWTPFLNVFGVFVLESCCGPCLGVIFFPFFLLPNYVVFY